MWCIRCEKDVPEFLWSPDKTDHPILIDYPLTLISTDIPESPNLLKITATTKVEKRMCGELHPEKKSILDLNISMPLEEAVGLALGAASTCWDPMDGTGVFMSERCEQIHKELVEYFNSKQPIY